MTIYSHSRLKTFEQCPFKFKLKYLDKVQPEMEQTIESHLGKVVHDTLEWVYKQVKKGEIPTAHEVISYYSEKWEKDYKPEFIIVKKEFTMKDYFNKGVRFLINYYTKNHPFNDNTIETEKRIFVELDKDGDYKIQGFIDRLSHNTNFDEYQIHDYKTSNSLPNQNAIQTDRQLPLYSIAIKQDFNAQKIQLIWHYLAFNKKIYSKRTDQQLEQLKQDTINQIKEIECTKDFPSCPSVLCNWCEYKSMCPTHGGKVGERQENLGSF